MPPPPKRWGARSRVLAAGGVQACGERARCTGRVVRLGRCACPPADQGVGVGGRRLQGVPVRARRTRSARSTVRTGCAVLSCGPVLARWSWRPRGPSRASRARDGRVGARASGCAGRAGNGSCVRPVSSVPAVPPGPPCRPGWAGNRHRDLDPVGQVIDRGRRVRCCRRATLGLDLRPQRPYVPGERRHRVAPAIRLGRHGGGALRLGVDTQPDQDDRAGEHGEHRGDGERPPAAGQEPIRAMTGHWAVLLGRRSVGHGRRCLR